MQNIFTVKVIFTNMFWNSIGLFLVAIFVCKQNNVIGNTVVTGAAMVCSYSANVLKIRFAFNTTDVIQCLRDHMSAQSLEFTDSGLQHIPPYLEILANVSLLNLSNNALETATFSSVPKICGKLKVVILDNNNIAILKRGDLDCLKIVEKFSIANNSLAIIENGTFNENLKLIDYIRVTYNRLSVLDTSLLSRLKESSCVSITVNASWNCITQITNSANLTIRDVNQSTGIYISLLHNNITTLDAQYFSNLFNITDFTQLLRLWNCGFDIRFNPLICDCAMFPFAKLLADFQFMDPDNPLFSVTCYTPSILRGKLVREVPPNQFNCSVMEDCPKTCGCNKTVALDLVTVNCGPEYLGLDLPEQVPKSKRIEIHMSNTNMKRVSYRDYLKNTSVFDVSASDISELQPSAISALEDAAVLKFDNNAFRYIPRHFENFNFSHGQILTLHGNPFICDCHSLWMKGWIVENKENIMFYEKILCSNMGADYPIVNVPDNRFVCASNLPLTTILAISGGILMILITVVTIIGFRKHTILVCLLSRSRVFRRIFGRNIRGSFKYDIFVIHSCEDDQIVYDIVSRLEMSRSSCKVCLGERDFALGKTIAENILQAIETSRTSVLLVSNSFLQSPWCNMEFREAHMRFLKDKHINLILVLLEDIDEALANTELKIYMRSHVYIRYSDTNFWTKLFACLCCESESETSPLIPT